MVTARGCSSLSTDLTKTISFSTEFSWLNTFFTPGIPGGPSTLASGRKTRWNSARSTVLPESLLGSLRLKVFDSLITKFLFSSRSFLKNMPIISDSYTRSHQGAVDGSAPPPTSPDLPLRESLGRLDTRPASPWSSKK